MHTPESRARAYKKVSARRHLWLLLHGPCIDCGSWDNLEVDHVDPEMKTDHKVWSWSRPHREAELAKCVIRCRTCHSVRHAKERTIDHPHGTRARYDKGCRCIVCKEAKREAVYEWRKRRGRFPDDPLRNSL